MEKEAKPSRCRYFDLMIAYKKKEFKMVSRQDVDFYKVKYEYTKQEAFKNTNKGLLCLFERIKSPNQRIVVGNT